MEEQQDKTNTPPNKSRRPFIVLLGLVVLIGAVLLVTVLVNHLTKDKTKSATPKVAVVQITKNGFRPATITVQQGTKVIWTNTDQALHQVASNPYPKDTDLPGLKSEILNNNQTYQYTANKTGTFGYHDQIQPTVNGVLVVEK